MLNNLGIYSVEQLANAPDQKLFSINQGSTLKQRASAMLKESGSEETPLYSVSMNKMTRYCLKSHNWWEMRVCLPDVNDPFAVREAIVYELSIEPFNRICFICAWIDQSDLKTMTFSPPFLLFYNPRLPLFHVRMTKTSLDELANKYVLLNVVEEISLMHRTLNNTN